MITGTAPRGIELRISKDLTVDSSPVSRPGLGTVVVPSDLRIETTMTVPSSGQFEWHVQPSMRPSQYHSLHLMEQWTVSCRNPAAKVHHEVQLTVTRGWDGRRRHERLPGRTAREPGSRQLSSHPPNDPAARLQATMPGSAPPRLPRC